VGATAAPGSDGDMALAESQAENTYEAAEAQGEELVSVVPFSQTIVISTADQLAQFLNNWNLAWQNHYNFVLDPNAPAGTFDMTGRGTFQGRGQPGGQPFTGSFDGNGHTITGLSLRPRIDPAVFGDPIQENSVGFIRAAGAGAVIRNVTFSGGSFHDGPTDPGGWNAAEGRIGMVIGRVVPGATPGVPVTIENVHLAGNTRMVTDRPNTVTTKQMGGFVGGVDSGVILNVRDISAANLQIENQRGRTQGVGGVIGNVNGTVDIRTAAQATNTINVRITGSTTTSNDNMASFAGGMIGRIEAGGTARIYDAVVTAPTALTDRAIRARLSGGGIVGWTGGGATLNITNAVNELNAVTSHQASARTGGIVGRVGGPTVLTNVTNNAEVFQLANTTTWIGGIIGGVEGATTLNGAFNYGRVGTTFESAIARVGGIIGSSEHYLRITNAHNRASRVYNRGGSSTATSTTNAAASQRLGGIVGHISWATTVSTAQRRAHLTNVTNRAIVGNPTELRDNAAGRSQLTQFAGGIVGNIANVAGARTYIREATNYGSVRASRGVGGIVGWSNSPNVSIRYAMNHGTVVATRSQASVRVGGIVGRSDQANLLVERSGNTGIVRSVRGNPGAAGVGGIVGTASGANTIIRESYNSGLISSLMINTAGILGRNEGSALIEDVYHVGTVVAGSSAAGDRSGTGILGSRRGGAVTIRRAFVSGQWGLSSGTRANSGAAVAISDAAPSSRAVAGITFSQVYVDRSTAHVHPGTTHANCRLQSLRPGITAISTELLTSGLLPGFEGRSVIDNQPTWQLGIEGDTEGVFRTYPYFTWQLRNQASDSARHDPFFESITVNVAGAPFAMDVNLSGSQTINKVGIWAWSLPFTGAPNGTGVRVFNPYVLSGTLAAGTWGAGNMPTDASWRSVAGVPNHTVSVTSPINRISKGLISQHGVVAFNVGEVSDRIALQAVDAVTGEVIGHASFTVPGSGHVYVEYPGIFIAGVNRFSPANPISISALGYEQRTYNLTAEQIAVGGIVRIPMTRANLQNVQVFVVDDAGNQIPQVDGAWPTVHYTTVRFELVDGVWTALPEGARTNISRTGDHYALTNVMVGDRIEGAQFGFEGLTVYVDAGQLTNVNPTTWRLDVVLSDARTRGPITIRVWEQTGYDLEGEPILAPIEIGPNNAPGNWLEMTVFDANRNPNVRPHGRGAAGTNQFTLNTGEVTSITEIQILAHRNDFADSDVIVLGDVLEAIYNDDDVFQRYEPIDIILAPPEGMVRFHFDGEIVEVPIVAGVPIPEEYIPIPATRYGRVGTPGQVFMGWFEEIFPLMHYVNNANRAEAFDLSVVITEAMLDDHGNLDLHGSWLQFGDLDGDGQVTLGDLALLQQHLVHVVVNIIAETANVSVSGTITLQDLALLQQHLLHMPVILGPVQ